MPSYGSFAPDTMRRGAPVRAGVSTPPPLTGALGRRRACRGVSSSPRLRPPLASATPAADKITIYPCGRASAPRGLTPRRRVRRAPCRPRPPLGPPPQGRRRAGGPRPSPSGLAGLVARARRPPPWPPSLRSGGVGGRRLRHSGLRGYRPVGVFFRLPPDCDKKMFGLPKACRLPLVGLTARGAVTTLGPLLHIFLSNTILFAPLTAPGVALRQRFQYGDFRYIDK